MQLPDFLHQDSEGEVRFVGHRIRLIDVIARYKEGHSPEGILLDHYPTLSLPLVHRGIAFYLENQDEVQAAINRNVAEMDRLAKQPRATPTLVELRRRLRTKLHETS